jgi:hypothetical protein
MRTGKIIRDRNGRFLKVTILNKIKYFCNFFMAKIDKWAKSVEK